MALPAARPKHYHAIRYIINLELHARMIKMNEQELKKSIEAVQNLQNELTTSQEKALNFLVKAGIVTTTGKLTDPYRQGA